MPTPRDIDDDDALLAGGGGGGNGNGKGKGKGRSRGRATPRSTARHAAGMARAAGRGTPARMAIAGVRRMQVDENRVLRAFRASPGRKDNFVTLHAMREHSKLPPERFDAAVNRLRRRGDLHLSTHEGLVGKRPPRESAIHGADAGLGFYYAGTGENPRRHRKNR